MILNTSYCYDHFYHADHSIVFLIMIIITITTYYTTGAHEKSMPFISRKLFLSANKQI
jgi:hypothetical protein